MTTGQGLYLLDTSVLVHYIRGSELARRIESQFNLRHRVDRPLVSVVSIGELRALTQRLGWGDKKVSALYSLLRELVVVDINNEDVLNAYGRITAWTEETGQPRGQQNDLWIAATARATGAHLITLDKDFDILDPKWLKHTFIPQT